jgi:hypothetical protein
MGRKVLKENTKAVEARARKEAVRADAKVKAAKAVR